MPSKLQLATPTDIEAIVSLLSAMQDEIKEWVVEHDGVQMYCHIHEDNAHSLGAFGSVDMHATEYKYCANHWG